MSEGRKTPRWVLWVIAIVGPLLFIATVIAFGRLHQEMDRIQHEGEQAIPEKPISD